MRFAFLLMISATISPEIRVERAYPGNKTNVAELASVRGAMLECSGCELSFTSTVPNVAVASLGGGNGSCFVPAPPLPQVCIEFSKCQPTGISYSVTNNNSYDVYLEAGGVRTKIAKNGGSITQVVPLSDDMRCSSSATMGLFYTSATGGTSVGNLSRVCLDCHP